jgi:hypothetical protein
VRLGLNLAFIHEEVAHDFVLAQPELIRRVTDLTGKQYGSEAIIADTNTMV